jgi:hypothetical protein
MRGGLGRGISSCGIGRASKRSLPKSGAGDKPAFAGIARLA